MKLDGSMATRMITKYVMWMLVIHFVLLKPAWCQDGEEEEADNEAEITSEASSSTDFTENVSEPNYLDFLGGNDTSDSNRTDDDYGTDVNSSSTGVPSETTTLAPPPTTDATPASPGSLAESVFLVDDFCTCDLKVGLCDVNCCCDEDCSWKDRQVFSHCQTRPHPVLDGRYCYQHHLVFSNNTEYQVEVTHAGALCIITDNLPRRTTYTPTKGARSMEEYQRLDKDLRHYPWQANHQPVQNFAETPYSAGGPVWGVDGGGNLFVIGIPSSVLGCECEVQEPLRYLEATRSTCTRVLSSLPDDCQTDPRLGLATFSSFFVVADPSRLFQNATVNDTENTVTAAPTDVVPEPSSPTPPLAAPPAQIRAGKKKTVQISANVDAFSGQRVPDYANEMELLPVKIYVCVEQNGEESCGETSLSDAPVPVYSEGRCLNVVREVQYTFTHNGTEGIVEVQASARLANLAADQTRVAQTFRSEYSWATGRDRSVFERSGRPGYITGKPVILGTLVGNVTEDGERKEAISLSSDPGEWLTILSPGGHRGGCQARSQVNFGVEMRSGCVVPVTQADLAQCTKLQQQFLDLLLGPVLQEAEAGILRVATYGDSSINSAGDWVPVLVPEVPRAVPLSGQTAGQYRCSELTLSLHFEVAYSLQGALVNPQQKIVAVVMRYGSPQTVKFTCNSFNCIVPPCSSPGCLGTLTQGVELVSSVSFVDVTRPPKASYASPPSLDVKLPYNFFYPFLPSSAGVLRAGVVSAWVVCCAATMTSLMCP